MDASVNAPLLFPVRFGIIYPNAVPVYNCPRLHYKETKTAASNTSNKCKIRT